jgi:hypothetical protein
MTIGLDHVFRTGGGATPSPTFKTALVPPPSSHWICERCVKGYSLRGPRSSTWIWPTPPIALSLQKIDKIKLYRWALAALRCRIKPVHALYFAPVYRPPPTFVAGFRVWTVKRRTGHDASLRPHPVQVSYCRTGSLRSLAWCALSMQIGLRFVLKSFWIHLLNYLLLKKHLSLVVAYYFVLNTAVRCQSYILSSIGYSQPSIRSGLPLDWILVHID